MFQYACGYALARKNNNVLKLDITGFHNYPLRKYELDKFSLEVVFARSDEIEQLKYKPISFVRKMVRRLLKKKIPHSSCYYKEPHFHVDSALFKNKRDLYIEGYWQSEKYFSEYRDELLQLFTLKDEIHGETQLYKENIDKIESVSLHIRRGDYITDHKTNNYHGICSVDYYRDAVEMIIRNISDPHFFIFSDDLDWAKENLDFIDNITFVEIQKNIPDHEEMYLMSICKHNIIANSSFSWWGAWLNQNTDKIVIAPKKWFNDSSIDTSDLTPQEWTKL